RPIPFDDSATQALSAAATSASRAWSPADSIRNPSRSASAASRTPGVAHNASNRDFKSSPEDSSPISSAAIGSITARLVARRGAAGTTGGGGAMGGGATGGAAIGGGAGGGGAEGVDGTCSGIGGDATLSRAAGGSGVVGAGAITREPSRLSIFRTSSSAATAFTLTSFALTPPP